MSALRVFDWDQQYKAGCKVCRRKNDRGGHNWTLFCTACETFFVYSICSCDGCCGDGAYGMYGGGRSYAIVTAGTSAEAVLLIQLGARLIDERLRSESISGHDWAGEARRLGPAAVAPLQGLLLEGTEYERMVAARVLGELGPGVGEAALLRALNDPSAAVREAAAAATGRNTIPAAFEPLMAALSAQDWQARHGAAVGLGRLGDARAAEGLSQLLTDERYEVRQSAAEALHMLGTPEAHAALCAALASPATPHQTRAKLVELLADVPGPAANAALMAGLADPERKVRERCALVLRDRTAMEAFDVLAAALADPEEQVRHAAAEALWRLDAERATALFDVAIQTEPSGWVAASMVHSLAWAPGKSPAERLIWALEHTHADVREGAGKGLGRSKSRAAVGPLIALLGREPKAAVRWAAAIALGEIGDPQAVPALVAALRDPEQMVRNWAAEALGKLRNERAVVQLLALLHQKDRYSTSRCAIEASSAATALVAIGGPAIPALLAALDGPDVAVRKLVVSAVRQADTNQATAWLLAQIGGSESEARQLAALEVRQLADSQAVVPLIAALNGDNERARQAAAATLGVLGGAQGIAALAGALRGKDQERRIEAAVALAVAFERDTSDLAVDALIRVLGDRSLAVCAAAAKALGASGDQRALEALRNLAAAPASTAKARAASTAAEEAIRRIEAPGRTT